MSRRKAFMVNAAIVVASTAMMLWLADIALKALELPIMYRAVMLLSGSKLFTDEHGVRRYETNKDVEQAAYIDGELAYRYKYRTNNLGLVSKYDHESGKNLDLMVVGDSVTEGQEVGPWFNSVQERLWHDFGKSSQNFAIAGNGFVEFERAAAFAKHKLNARKAMLVFIGGDMLRPGDFMQANDECSTYSTIINRDSINCTSGNTTWFHYDSELSDNELVNVAKSWQRFGLIRTMRKPVISSLLEIATIACRLGVPPLGDNQIASRYRYHCETTKAVDDLRAEASEQSGQQAHIATVPASGVESGIRDKSVTTTSNANVTHIAAPTDMIPAYTIHALEKVLQLYGSENVLLVAIPGGANSIRGMQTESVFRRAFDKKFNSPIQFVDISESCKITWAPKPGKGPGRGWGHPTAEGYLQLSACFLSNKEIMEFAKN